MSEHRIIKLVIFLALLLIPPVTAYTDGAYNLKLQSMTPGWTYRSVTYNGTLYSQEGFALRIYDLTTPNISTHFVNQISFLDGNGGTEGLKARKGFLYLSGGNQLRIYDISDRLNPVFVSNISTLGGDLAIDGNYAYSVGGKKITIIDISDNLNPKPVSQIPAVDSHGSVSAGDGYLYAGQNANRAFSIYDVTDPKAPSLIGTTSIVNSGGSAGIYDLEYLNNALYAAEFKTSLQVWDVTDKSSPSLLWYCKNATPAYSILAVGLQIVGKNLYVSHRYGSNSLVGGNGGLTIWNITNRIPVIVGYDGSINLGYTETMSTDGTYAVLHQGKMGATIYKVSIKRAPVRKVHLPVPGEIRIMGVSQIGHMTVLATGGYDGGNWYYNVTDPTTLGNRPPVAGWNIKPTARQPDGMPIFGNYSYTHGGSNGNYGYIVNLTDIESPDFNPDQTGKLYQNDNQIQSEYATENILYTNHRYAVPAYINSNGGLVKKGSAGAIYLGAGYQRVWNTTDKEHFRLVNVSTITTPYGQMYRYDDTKYNKTRIIQICDTGYYSGLRRIYILDTDPLSGNLTIFKNVSFMTEAPDVDNAYTYDALSKHVYAYSGSSAHTIHAFNVSDPDNIYEEAGVVSAYITGQSMASNGTDVFLGGVDAGQGSIIMISFADMAHPKVIDHIHNYGGWSPAMTFYNGTLYAGGGGSVEAIKVIPGSSSPPGKSMSTQESTEKVPTRSPGDTPTPASPLRALAIIGAVVFGIVVLRK